MTGLDPGVVSRTEMLMGLPFSVHLRRPFDAPAADAALASLFDTVRVADRVFSTYRSDSDVSRIDRGELTVEAADPTVAPVVALADQARACTGGAFDIRPGGRFDPSGVVKGWAAERGCRALLDLGADFYCNAGGDILVHAADRPWRIGIEHPANPAALMAVLELTSGAVATSGPAHRGAHIWSGAGRPAHGIRQATVVGPTLTWADILATAVVAAGATIADTSGWPPGYDFLLVDDDGEIAASTGLLDRLAPDVPAPPVRFRVTR